MATRQEPDDWTSGEVVADIAETEEVPFVDAAMAVFGALPADHRDPDEDYMQPNNEEEPE